MARTKEIVETELNAVRAAYMAILQGQEYRIGTRGLTRADFTAVAAEKAKLERELTSLESGRSGGLRVKRVIPRDL